MSAPPRSRALPVFLERRSTDEFLPPAYTQRDLRAIAYAGDTGPRAAARAGVPLPTWWASRRGTASGLRALNAAAGRDWYRVPAEAELDEDAANEALGGDEVIIDVQTHFVAERPECRRWDRELHALYAGVAPDWWRGLDEMTRYDLAAYLACVFLRSETALAVLTSAPGRGPDRMLFNREMAATSALAERLGGGARLLHHAVAQPGTPEALAEMEQDRDRYQPAAWKVYTLGHTGSDGRPENTGWWLDDEAVGVPFLEQARALGVRRVAAHKGISALVPTGSPRDVGPAAAAFPDIDFLIYHSGYELPRSAAPEEGPFSEATAGVGTNRLVASLRDAGVGPGRNVYAELGSTWFALIRRPEEAAHVLGKLLLAVGEDHVLWGTDAIWYGPAQPAIDAFRAFEIPGELCEAHGYPELTPRVKAKILGANAARVYGLDLAAVRERAATDDLAWARAILAEIEGGRDPLAGLGSGA